MRRLTALIALTAFLLSPLAAPCLEKLSTTQMKDATARSGVTLAFEDVITATHKSEFTIENPDDNAQFISFENISTFTTFNTGNSDYNGDGYIQNLKIDVFSTGNQSLVSMQCTDMELQTDFSAEKIIFCGNPLGSMAAENITFSSFHLLLGAHGESGIDMEFGSQLTIDSITYRDNLSNALVFSNIIMAESVSGSMDEPSTWIPEGEFTFGSISNNLPVTLDVAQDNQEKWHMTDSEGTAYTVDNPRNGSGFIALNLPMKGSLRVETMAFEGTDLGSLVMDNMNVQKLYIEIPGRGLGVP